MHVNIDQEIPLGVARVVGIFGCCAPHLGSNLTGDIFSMGALVCNEILGW